MRIVFNAIGLGDLNNHSISVLQKALQEDNIYRILLRDSYARFRKIFNVSCEVKETQDPALYCTHFFQRSDNFIAEYGIGCIDADNSLETIKQIIQFMNAHGLDWRVFCNGWSSDMQVAEKAMRECGLSDEIPYRIIKRPLNEEEFISTVTGFSKIVSFRLHSHIVATAFQIPTYGFVWDNKVKEFLEKQEREKYVGRLDSDISLDCIFEPEFSSLNIRLIEENALLSKNNLLDAIYEEYTPENY